MTAANPERLRAREADGERVREVREALRRRRTARERYDAYWQVRAAGEAWSLNTLNTLAVERREADRALDVAVAALDKEVSRG